MATENTHVVDPTAAHTHTIIFLHDRGSSCEEFANKLLGSMAAGLIDQPRTLRDLLPSVRWVFPRAPILPSKRLDTDVSQWFDIWSMQSPTERPELQNPGLHQASRRISSVLEAEEARVPRERIFLAGIGQGFAVAITTFYINPRGNFAGLIGLGSWLPSALCSDTYRRVAGSEWLTEEAGPSRNTPVFLSHSADDDVVPIASGRELRNIARVQKLRVEWREYEDGGHWLKEPQGVDDIAHFINAQMAEG
ncbi:lysophospholipase II [Nemania sp. NC0429]|nr:lysophospholipase II [Nemania sp. NC0429]